MKPFTKNEPQFRKNCTYQGKLNEERVCCDAVGQSVSNELCKYCQFMSRTFNFKPYKVIVKLFHKIDEASDELVEIKDNYIENKVIK